MSMGMDGDSAMIKKNIPVEEVRAGDTIMWYDTPTKVLWVEPESGYIRVYTAWIPSGSQDLTNHIFGPGFGFTKIVDDRPPEHSPCRDSDCDCIFDMVGI